MTTKKLTPAQRSMALCAYTWKSAHISSGHVRRSVAVLEKLNLVHYTDSDTISALPGVTRVQHPSGTVWLNTEGEVLAVE